MEQMKKEVQEVWNIDKDMTLDGLVIGEKGSIKVPEGKRLYMTVNGICTAPAPGVYEGKVQLRIVEPVCHTYSRVAGETPIELKAALYIKDGKPQESNSAFSFNTRQNTEICVDGGRIVSEETDSNGIVVENGSCEIRDLYCNLESFGVDGLGKGAGILTLGDAKVLVKDSTILTKGGARTAVAAFEDSEMTFENCRLHADGPELTAEERERAAADGHPCTPPWQIGLRGSAHVTTLDERGKMNFYNCSVSTRNWGVISVDDDASGVRVYGKDSDFTVTGDHGYGCFGINCDVEDGYQERKEYGAYHRYDHCRFHVSTCLMYMSLGKTGAEFLDHTVIRSKRWGLCAFRSSGGFLRIAEGSDMQTGKACFSVKGSAVRIEVDHATVKSDTGTILQVIDNDDPGYLSDHYAVPQGEDHFLKGRDLTTASVTEDVFVKISNTELSGDFYNATTNLLAETLPDPQDVEEVPPNFVHVRGVRGKDLQGPKNLEVCLENARIQGKISSAKAVYHRELQRIDVANCEEMGNVTCMAQATVNNGVILHLDHHSVWEVTGDSYLTALTLEKSSVIYAGERKKARMTVDGIPTEIRPGTYKGQILITVK